MEPNNDYQINGYKFSIENIKTIKKFYRGVILVLYRSDINAYCNPASVIYTPGKFKSPQEAETEAFSICARFDIWKCTCRNIGCLDEGFYWQNQHPDELARINY